MFRRACGVFRRPQCGECLGELMERFGSFLNVSEACRMFRKLVECFGSLWTVSEACVMQKREKRIVFRTVWPNKRTVLNAICLKYYWLLLLGDHQGGRQNRF